MVTECAELGADIYPEMTEPSCSQCHDDLHDDGNHDHGVAADVDVEDG